MEREREREGNLPLRTTHTESPQTKLRISQNLTIMQITFATTVLTSCALENYAAVITFGKGKKLMNRK